MKKHKHTFLGLELLRLLASEDYRIFTLKDTYPFASKLKIPKNSLYGIMHVLVKNQWIEKIKNGMYAFTLKSGMSEPPHEFEIAQKLIEPSAIAFWTAMQYHQITQQTPSTIFSITKARAIIPPKYKKRFIYKNVKNSDYFGFQKVWIGHARIEITDLERTLIDGLCSPDLCGGFAEVYNAFKFARAKINLDKIIQYGLKKTDVTKKRLGWMLDQFGFSEVKLKKLLHSPIYGFRKLNVLGPAKGAHNNKWKIIVNL